jgi:hypothetical protein
MVAGRRGSLVRASFSTRDGELAGLQARADAARPHGHDAGGRQFDLFMLHHANEKVERPLQSDPESSLYSMHATLDTVLEIHYRVHGCFKPSSKKLLADLDTWDEPLAWLLRSFVATADVQKKFTFWSQIVDHVAGPLGGRQPIETNVCACAACVADQAALRARRPEIVRLDRRDMGRR